MALDAICLQAVVREIAPQVEGLKIEKIQQPARDQVILLLRSNKRLLLNAGANAPRLQLTELLRDNPAEPPMFCMLLRKHLVGARVAEITQPGLERLVRIELDVTDDFGQPGHRTLVLEAMGRRSNLILLDGGQGHLNAVQPILEAFGLRIPMYGMVKDDRHRTRAIASDGGEISISAHKRAFNLVTAIQDEVHRFSITYSRSKHRKSGLESVLTGIPGIGMWNAYTNTARQIRPPIVPPTTPKIAPSTVFLGLTFGQSLCLPIARPPKYAAPSPT